MVRLKADLGRLGIAPRIPVIGEGVHMQDKSGMGPGSKSTHSGGYKPTKFAPQHNKQAVNIALRGQ